MMKGWIKRVAAKLGYDIRRRPRNVREEAGFVLHDYRRPDGGVDRERYLRVQTEGNRRKIHQVAVYEENIAFLAEYIRGRGGPLRFGLCHGTRRGREQEWFRKHLGCEVLGTEISDTAGDFPHTLQWDFHEVKPEWVDAVDFIYSNSLDHSYDPEKCLNAWMSCVREGGLCILEHNSAHEPRSVTELDPFGVELPAMPFLITSWAKGRYCVREILRAPVRKEEWEHCCFIILERLRTVPVDEERRL